MGSNDLITVKEASEKLGVSQKTVYRYLESGILPATKFGGNDTTNRRHYQIKRTDFERFAGGK